MFNKLTDFVRVQMSDSFGAGESTLRLHLPDGDFRHPETAVATPTPAPAFRNGPYGGYLVICDDIYNPHNFEIVKYDVVTFNEDLECWQVNVTERGVDGTTDQNWSTGAWVYQAPIARNFQLPPFLQAIQKDEDPDAYNGYAHYFDVKGNVRARLHVEGDLNQPYPQPENPGDPVYLDWRKYGATWLVYSLGNNNFTWSQPEGICDLHLFLVTDPTVGNTTQTFTWPASVRWPGGSPPNFRTGNSHRHWIRFRHVSGVYYASYDLNMS